MKIHPVDFCGCRGDSELVKSFLQASVHRGREPLGCAACWPQCLKLLSREESSWPLLIIQAPKSLPVHLNLSLQGGRETACITSGTGRLRHQVCPGLRHLHQNRDSDPHRGASELMTRGQLLHFFLPQIFSPEGQLKEVTDTDSAQTA